MSVEIYPEEELLFRRAKADAALRDQTFREWLVAAVAQRLEAGDAR